MKLKLLLAELIWTTTKRNRLLWPVERRLVFWPYYQHRVYHIAGGWLPGRAA